MKTTSRLAVGSIAVLTCWSAVALVVGQAPGDEPRRGGLFAPLAGGSSAGAEDPFAAARAADPSPQDRSAQGGPAQAAPSAPAGGDAVRQESDALVYSARRALAVGDVARARQFVEQAEGQRVAYLPLEDAPGKVAATIDRFEALMQRQAEEGGTQAFRRAHSELLMEQATELFRWQDLDEAERLARDADGLGVTYNYFDAKPAELLRDIAAARRAAGPTTEPAPEGAPADVAAAKQRVLEMLSQARAALLAGDFRASEDLVRKAQELGVPDSAFGTREDRPGYVWLDLQQARRAGGAVQTSYEAPLASEPVDGSSLEFAQAPVAPRENPARASRGQPAPQAPIEQSAPQAPVEQTAAQLTAEERKVATEVADREIAARKLLEAEPLRSIELLKEARTIVEAATLSPETQARMLRKLDRAAADAQQYIEDNRARIELDERNRAVLEEVDRARWAKVEVQEKLATMVDEYNTLVDEQRFAEAEVLAKRAQQLAPEEPVAMQLAKQSRMIRAIQSQREIRDDMEEGFLSVMQGVDEAGIPQNGDHGTIFPDNWDEITKKRRDLAESSRRRSEKEILIEQRLRTPVSLKFRNAPLSTVLDHLGALSQVNVYLDMAGLAEEAVTTDTPVTIELRDDIMLKSALNLILRPLRLDYVIKDEVLKVTSEQYRDGNLAVETYYVADLVSPIPNFLPNGNMGLAGALRDAFSYQHGFGMPPQYGNQGPLAVVASRDGSSGQSINPAVLAQMPSAGGAYDALPGQPAGRGPGGLGGAPEPDFESLIELITSTIRPQSWDEVGGPGSIQEFETNLSLVISQTQEVHEEIRDLLEQLRRLQDLQVAIEVRFITINDNFFERMGIDFDFDIDDDIDAPFQVFGRADETIESADQISEPPFTANGGVGRDVIDRDHGPSASVGMSLPGVFSTDLDIPFRQDSFGSSRPAFGGFDPATAATLGFAILSDVEAFFFIEAAQGDSRTNILQAPKVTLFNGQQAVVADQSFSPFVISIIPVVGDFAAAQQPVILVLAEGTMLTVQAVVSSDRRFVRLTVVPYFSQIGDVDTFTFTGSETTIEESGSEGPDDATTGRDESRTTIRSGTTVQLPTIAIVTVSTTVSVPDGGTILLGGIKRLRESRDETGVPILNKIPYVKRLFSNAGIGREAQSLLMMVTPRIIIQEEEEENLGINTAP